MSELITLAAGAKAWPFEQARLLVDRVKKTPKDGPVIFETGYGPSGLPHIGTFGEVVRTTMVLHAFRALTGGEIPAKIICVSDDMDGMRKIPDNVPNHDMLAPYMQRPLTDVPDPFGTHESFAHHNNARLRAFLDGFGFEYEFKSATELYKSGAFDTVLLRALERYDDIMAVMLPTLGEERRQTYSPFLPISPTSGRVLYVPMKRIDAKAGTVTFDDEDGTEITQPVTGGRAKMQWKPDFGMRWAALGVDFEMFGKDHQPNQQVYARICKILGREPPINYVYELFLDDQGEKISKSKGNGISVEQWLRYAPQESLALYMYQKPRTAKRLYFDVIPKAVDEYIAHLDAFPKQNLAEQVENPVWHIHNGAPPAPEMAASYAPNDSVARASITFALLLNLVAAANAETKDQLWRFIGKYAPGASAATHPFLDRLCEHAIHYYDDFVKPTKNFRLPTDRERAAFEDLIKRFDALPAELTDGEAIQAEVYAVGKEHGFEPLRDWFKALYEVLFGQEQGPRFGSFAAIFGLRETAELMRRGLEGKLAK
ncbi:MAG: lysine--tRNA ligase [Hyphomonadaceae bacterium]|nr:lysine--tRNA ligase [Hyphomonadaceae bacterium]